MIAFTDAKLKISTAVEHYEEETRRFRVGRPSQDIFATVKVEAYGSMSPLLTMANVNVVDATMVTVQPWDKSLLQPVMKAIQASDLGFNPQLDGDIVRIPIPALTQEKRLELVKKLKESAEHFRIEVRVIRKDVMSWIDTQKKEGNLPEDDAKTKEKDLQGMVDDANKKIDSITAEKREILDDFIGS